MRAALLSIALLCASACGNTPVDTSGLAALDGYTEWDRFDTQGPVPGHGDTYRVIYINEPARAYGHAGIYPEGSVVVKEIRDNDGGSPGDLRYIAIMRKLREAPTDAELHGGWLFTMASELGAEETYDASCWGRCHAQAPVDGAWFDYGR